MLNFDRHLFLLLNAGPAPNATVAFIAILAAKFIVFVVPLYLVVLWLLGSRQQRFAAISIFLALLIGIVLSYAVGLALFRPRPFMAGIGNTLVHHRANSSFPSNHGITLACCAAVLFMLGRKAEAWVATILGIIVAWSRIYIGVHFPLDMVGSVIVGIAAAKASLLTMGRYGTALLNLAEEVQRLLLAPFTRS